MASRAPGGRLAIVLSSFFLAAELTYSRIGRLGGLDD
jgi:hypothetical protein